MGSNFIFIRNLESQSGIRFFRLGYNGINKPDGGANIKVDSYFEARPANLNENITNISITSQYIIFGQNSLMFALFNITSPFELGTPHLVLDKVQMKELIELHHQDCIGLTRDRVIHFPNGEMVQIPDQCIINSDFIAEKFEQEIRMNRHYE